LLRCEGIEASPEGKVKLNMLAASSRDFAIGKCKHRAMPEFRFDPRLTLKGNIVVRNLDDAVSFMVGCRKAHGPELFTSGLHRLEGAAGEAEERDAALAFRAGQRQKILCRTRPINEAMPRAASTLS
jgi:hypothetical protein